VNRKVHVFFCTKTNKLERSLQAAGSCENPAQPNGLPLPSMGRGIKGEGWEGSQSRIVLPRNAAFRLPERAKIQRSQTVSLSPQRGEGLRVRGGKVRNRVLIYRGAQPSAVTMQNRFNARGERRKGAKLKRHLACRLAYHYLVADSDINGIYLASLHLLPFALVPLSLTE
jgi:hypothetical protein